MKKISTLLLVTVFALPLFAQDAPEPKKEKGWSIGIVGGLLTPTGDYGKTYGVTPHIGIRMKTAVGGFFGLFGDIPNLHNDMFFSYGFSSFSDDYKSSYKKLFGKDPNDDDAGSAISVVNTIRYTFKDILPLVDPYAGVGIGVSYVLGGSLTSTVSSLGSFGYGVALKAGAELPLTDWFAVDASADYILGTFSFFNVGATAVFKFGGQY